MVGFLTKWLYIAMVYKTQCLYATLARTPPPRRPLRYVRIAPGVYALRSHYERPRVAPAPAPAYTR